MTIWIKICGVTLPDDAARVSAAGADFIGLNFWSGSKRRVAAERAPMLAGVIRSAGAARVVGVFVDPEIEEVLAVTTQVRLDAIQLHGDESPSEVAAITAATGVPAWKAIAVSVPSDLGDLTVWPVDAFLLDSPTPGRGGSGAVFDWTIARDARRRFPACKVVLAGGLSPANVAAAIEAVAPWAVDVASGVEAAPGVKDPAKVAAFISAARGHSR